MQYIVSLQIKREILKHLAPHIKRYGGSVKVFRGERVYYASSSRGSTFWSASRAAANVYSAGGYGQFTKATFYVGTHVYFEDRLSNEFVEFIDKLANLAINAGCKLSYSTTNEWIQCQNGRTSWAGDFYAHCVDALMNAKLWPKSIRYTILGNNWDRYSSTHHAAELIVHNRVQLLQYKQDYSRPRHSKVDCRRTNVHTDHSSKSDGWGGAGSEGWDC
jgi:hypothetical protein